MHQLRRTLVVALAPILALAAGCQGKEETRETARKTLTPKLKPDPKPVLADELTGTTKASEEKVSGTTTVSLLPVTKVRTDRAAAGSFRRATFKVEATSDNNATGWFVTPGEIIRVKASGSWTNGQGIPAFDANGSGVADGEGCKVGMLAVYNSVYSDAWHEEHTCVGIEGQHKVTTAGLLFLRMWDWGYEDNEGTLEVELERVADPAAVLPPPPPAWTAEETYGEWTFDVPATTLWVPTGLYLRPGDELEVAARGRANMYPEAERETSAEKPEFSLYEGCLVGALRGLIVDPAKGPAGDKTVCLGRDAALVAPSEGHLFLGLTDGWIADNSGAFKVTVRSTGRRIPERWSAEDFGVKALSAQAPADSFGTRLLRLASASGWTNTGVHLAAGQKARIEARGAWAEYPGSRPNPDSDPEAGVLLNCRYGQLRAVVGYELKDLATRIVCVGQTAEITADHDGPLLLSIVDGSDYLYDNFGTLAVVVQSDEGHLITDLDLARLATMDASTLSGFAELRGGHVSAVVPAVAVAAVGAAGAADAMRAIDGAVETMVSFLGNTPRHQALVQIGIDGDLTGHAQVATSGYPMRLHPGVFDAAGVDTVKFLDAANLASDPAHRILTSLAISVLGRAHPQRFAPGSGPIRAWADVLAGAAADRLGFSLEADPCESEEAKSFDQSGSFEQLLNSREVAGCFLKEVRAVVDDAALQKFFVELHSEAEDRQPAWYADPKELFAFTRQRLEKASGRDLKTIFEKFKIVVD